jgi:hypothetical protein
MLLRRRDRRIQWIKARSAAFVLAGGLLIGLPQLYTNWRTFADPQSKPILERIGRPRTLSADDPARSHYVRNLWVWGKLALGAAGIALLRIRGLGLLWCTTLAGYALQNSAIVTGMEFENFHWSYVHAAMGEILTLGTVACVLDRWRGARPTGLSAAWLLPAAWVVLALVWRGYEALHAPNAVQNSRWLAEVRPLRSALAALEPDHALAGPEAANVALLFTRCAQLYQFPYTWNSFIPDEAVHQRHALNGWLQGLDRETYAATAAADRVDYGKQSAWRPQAVQQARVALFDQLLRHPDPELVERYRADYLLLPAAAPTPERAGPWTLIQQSSHWNLWCRLPPNNHLAVP